jgi:hypothetical protein
MAKQRIRSFSTFLSITLILLALLVTSSALAQVTGDSRWPGLNPTVTQPSYPALCTSHVDTANPSAPNGVLWANQIAASNMTTTTDTRIASALTTCKPGTGGAAVGLELKSNGSNNAFVIAPITLPAGLTLIVDPDVIVFGSTSNSSGTPLITAAKNTTTAYNGGALGYWGIMGYGIIDQQGSEWGWKGGDTGGSYLLSLGTGSSSPANYFTLYQITLQNSAEMHVIGNSNYFLAYDVKVINPADSVNTDGIDPSGPMSNVTIYNSFISDGDDHIATNSGNGAVTNVTIANNHLYAGHGISVGSYTTDGASNILVNNVAIDNNGGFGSNSKNSLRIKSDDTRGGLVENVLYDGVCIENGGHIFVFDPYYGQAVGSANDLYPNFQEITLQNINVVNEDKTSDDSGVSTLKGYDYNGVNHPLLMTMDNVVFSSANSMSTDFAVGTCGTSPTQYGDCDATLTFGPDPATPESQLATLAGTPANLISVTNNIDDSNPPYDCTSKFTYLAGELFGSSTTVTTGGTVTLTAIVQPIVASTGLSMAFVAPAPTGTISIYDNGNPTPVVSQTVTAPAVSYLCAKETTTYCSSKRSLTTITIPSVTAGTHVYTASYSGDIYYLPSTATSGIAAIDNAVGEEIPVAPTFPSFTVTAAGTPVVTAIVTALSKTYDGTTNEPIANVTCTLTPSESNLTCAPTAATFASANVGSGIVVTATGITLSGTAASSYTLASSSATTTAAITTATPTLSMTCTGGVFNNTAYSCTGSAVGIDGITSVAGSWSFSPASEITPGIYTVNGTFTSSNSNYAGGTSSGTLTITQATPTLSVTCAGGVFNNTPYSCGGSATGVLGATVAGSFAFSYTGTGSTTYGPSATAPTAAGTYSAVGTFTSTNGNYTSNGTANGTLTITTATPVLSATCTGGVYNNTPYACSGSATGVTTVGGSFAFSYTGTGATIYGPSAAAPTAAGTYSAVGTFTSTNSNYTSGGTATGTLTITPATPTLALTCTEVPYDGSTHACSGTATGVGAATVNGTWSYNPASETAAGSYSVTGTFTSGDTNYNSGTATGTLRIDAISPTLTLTCTEVPYDGNPHSCSGSATGVGAAAVSGSWSYNPVNETGAGSYSVTGTFTSTNANYTNGTASGTLKIDTISPTLTLTCTEVPYDGNTHSCSGSATGVGAATVSGSWSYNPVNETAAGSYPVTGTFTSTNTNYTSGTQGATLIIDKATQSPTVTCATVNFDGNPHSCVISGGISPCSSDSTTNVPGSSTLALSCAADANHNAWSGTGALVINPAAPSLTMTCTEVTYDGNPHSCTGSATGVAGAAVNGSWGFNPSSGTSAGTYPATGTFTSSDPNYATGGTATGTLKIDMATLTLTLTCTEVAYDGNTHSCTGSATGVGSAAVNGSWSLSPASETAAGSYPTTGTFTSSNSNYVSGSTANGTLKIDTVTPTLSLTCPEVSYDGSAHSCSGTATGVGGATVTGSWSFSPGSQVTVGSYPTTATFTSSNTNYVSGGTASGTLKIDALTPALSLTCTEVSYDGNAHACIGVATGVGGATVSGSWNLNPVSETAVGSYPVAGTFTSSNTNYVSGGSASGTLKIDAPLPTLTLTCTEVPYDGTAHFCTGSAIGVGGATVNGSWSYNPPSVTTAGSTSVIGSFSSNDPNYGSGTITSTQKIDTLTPSLSLTCAEVPYDGAAHSCTGSATGLGGVPVTGTWSFSPTNVINASSTSVLGTFSSGDPNYISGTATGTLKIDLANQTPSVTCPASLTFDGSPHSCTITGGIGSCTSPSVTSVPGATPPLGCAGDTNHAPWSGTGTITINPATPALAITCGTYAYDGTAKSCTASATGVGRATVLGSFGYSPAQSEIATGVYSIVATFSSSDTNYVSGGQIGGTLTIDGNSPIDCPPLPSSVVYGNPAIPFVCTSVAGAQLTYTVTGPATWSAGNLNITGVGPVTVKASQAAGSSWPKFSLTNPVMTVTKMLLTITADSPTWTFGNPEPKFTVNGGQPLTMAYTTDPQPTIIYSVPDPNNSGRAVAATSPLGTYPIQISSTSSILNNYTVTLNGGFLTYQANGTAIGATPATSAPIKFSDTLEGSKSAVTTISVKNNTGIASVLFTPSIGNDFSVDQLSGCYAARGQTCTFHVYFQPQTQGTAASPLLTEPLTIIPTDNDSNLSNDPNYGSLPPSLTWNVTGNAVGGIQLSPVNFGSTPTPDLSINPQAVTVTNNAVFPVTITSITSSPATSFVVAAKNDATNCLYVAPGQTAPMSVLPNQSCQFTVTFEPVSGKANNGTNGYTSLLTVTAKATDGTITDTLNPAKQTLSATESTWAATATAGSFPVTQDLSVGVGYVTVNNPSGVPMTVSAASFTKKTTGVATYFVVNRTAAGDGINPNCFAGAVTAGNSCVVPVMFEPVNTAGTAMEFDDTLTITATVAPANGGTKVTVPSFSAGVSANDQTWSITATAGSFPNTQDLSEGVGYVNVSNPSGVPMTVSAASFTTKASGVGTYFVISKTAAGDGTYPNCFAGAVAGGNSCVIPITFEPVYNMGNGSTPDFNDTLTITAKVAPANGSAKVSAPILPVGVSASDQTWTIVGTAGSFPNTQDLSIGVGYVTVANSSGVPMKITAAKPTNSPSYFVVNTSPTASGDGVNPSCYAGSVAEGGSCVIPVTFAPVYNATGNPIAYNDSLAITATVLPAFKTAWVAAPVANVGLSATDIPWQNTFAVTGSFPETTQDLSIGPGVVTVYNYSFQPMKVTAVTDSPSTYFVITRTAANTCLASGAPAATAAGPGTCFIPIQFEPKAGMGNGSTTDIFTSNLSITASVTPAIGGRAVTVPVTGLQLSATDQIWGIAATQTSAPSNTAPGATSSTNGIVTVTNTSGVLMTVRSAVSSPVAYFAPITDPTATDPTQPALLSCFNGSVAAGGSCIIPVQFKPKAGMATNDTAGTYQATLTITTTVAPANGASAVTETAQATLLATDIQSITYNPAFGFTLTFTGTAGTAVPSTIAVFNNSDSGMSLSTPSVSNVSTNYTSTTNPFAVSTTCSGTTGAAGKTCAITVKATVTKSKPTAGSNTATGTITFTDPSSGQQVSYTLNATD